MSNHYFHGIRNLFPIIKLQNTPMLASGSADHNVAKPNITANLKIWTPVRNAYHQAEPDLLIIASHLSFDLFCQVDTGLSVWERGDNDIMLANTSENIY